MKISHEQFTYLVTLIKSLDHKIDLMDLKLDAKFDEVYEILGEIIGKMVVY